MGNVLAVVWTVVGFVVFHTAMLVWAALMLPNPVERARQRVEKQAGRHFFLGAVVAALNVSLGVAFLQGGGGLQLLGWILMSPVLISAVIGGAAFARLLAARIQERMQHTHPASTAGRDSTKSTENSRRTERVLSCSKMPLFYPPPLAFTARNG